MGHALIVAVAALAVGHLAPVPAGVVALAAAVAVGVWCIAAVVVVVPFALNRLLARASAPPDAGAGLAVFAAGLLLFALLVGGPASTSPLVLLVCACAAAAGAVLSVPRLTSWAGFVGAAAAAVTLASSPSSSLAAQALPAVAALAFVAGFAALGRGLFFGVLKAARVQEQARLDGELMRLYDEARLYRLIGGDDEAAAAGSAALSEDDRRLVAQTLSVRDGCYRLLRLGARAVPCDAIALYLAEPHSSREQGAAALPALLLKEQLSGLGGNTGGDVDECAPKLAGGAGAVGLAQKKRVPIRLRDKDGPGVRVHRRGARSVLCVPLLLRDVVQGVLVFDRSRATPSAQFTDEDELFALALCAELLELLRTERLLQDLDVDRKKKARIFAAARAFGGVVRTSEAVEATLKVVLDVVPHASAAVVELVKDPMSDRTALKVVKAQGPLLARLAQPAGQALAVSDDTWVGRAILQRTALPHVALSDAGVERGLYEPGDARARSCGDLRVVPLFAQGNPVGALVVATNPGERLRAVALDAVVAAADLAGVAVAGAMHFEALERQATTDGLTGLYNRRTLDRLLDEAIARARRNQTPLCVLLTDVDHFKSVNDTYGHGTGDDVLRGVSKTLQQTARTSDVVARYGGEEFVVVLDGTDLQGALRSGERMRLAIKALRFGTDKGPLSVTSSFGVAVYADGDSAHDLLERADGNLYKAKQGGRDRVVG